ncbi:MAG: beta-lactamase family protein, partial [Clostridia bacterium]|nr:beta-lactamase family protein [Clostridia bacterium]
LFTMSAGLDYDLNSAPIRNTREKNNGACPTVETIRALAWQPLGFDPGEHYKYSLCHDVLGALIEIVSGMSFGEYLKKNIFDPLEMSDSTFVLNDEQKKRLMCQYRYNGELGRAEKITTACPYKLGEGYESGGAGILSTLTDYGKFVDALACGGIGASGARIISEDMLSLMRENQFTDPVRFSDFAKPGYGYGLGVRTHLDRGASLRPCPLGEFGWGGAAGSQMIIDPVNHLSMFYLQHMLGTPFNISDRIVNAIYS